MSINPGDKAIRLFCIAAEKAAEYELRARLTLGVVEDSNRISAGGRLVEVIAELKRLYSDLLTGEEWGFLLEGRQLRNKLFHAEFHQITEMLQVPSGGVMSIDITGKSGQELVQSIANIESTGMNVSDTSTLETGVFGWLLESMVNGALERLVSHLDNCIDLLGKLQSKMSV